MPRLPDSQESPVGLNLIYIPSLNPDALNCRNWLRRNYDRCRHYCRCAHDSRRSNYGSAWTSKRSTYDSADDASCEAWPEMPSASSPCAMVMMVVMMMSRSDVVTPHWTSAAPVRACEQARCKNGKSNRQYHFLIHFLSPFSIFTRPFAAQRNVRRLRIEKLTIFFIYFQGHPRNRPEQA